MLPHVAQGKTWQTAYSCWYISKQPMAVITELHELAKLLKDIHSYHGAFGPQCALKLAPMLFVYAKYKPFMCHSQQWLARVQQKAGNQLTAMKAEHGLMREQPEQFNQWMHEWLHDGQS